MEENRRLFKKIFWGFTGFLIFLFTSILLLFTFNIQIADDDKIPLMMMGIFILFIISMLILVGSLIHRDAKKNNMNEWMWTLVGMYTPYFIGIIIYLVVRNNERQKLKCPKCGKMVEKDFAICPECGRELKGKCENCGKYVKEDWRICPYCENKFSK